jgi:hypothetical protein
MSIRKLTRNPGWSRLFKVFAGLWYAVLVSVFVWGFVEQEQKINKEIEQPSEARQLLNSLRKDAGIDYVQLMSNPPPEGFVLLGETIDVRMPNGTIIRNAPKGTSKGELTERLKSAIDEVEKSIRVADKAGRSNDVVTLAKRRDKLLSAEESQLSKSERAELADLHQLNRQDRRKAYAFQFLPWLFIPLIFLFSMRMFRYVIEGFSLKGE